MTVTPQFATLEDLEVAAYHYATQQTGRHAIGTSRWCVTYWTRYRVLLKRSRQWPERCKVVEAQILYWTCKKLAEQ